MASYNELIALIDAYINQNGVQAITGQVLNGVLRAMVDQLGRGYTIMGTAVPSTDPGTPDGPESWFASTPGTYTDMGGLTVANAELALLSYTPSDGWAKTTLTQGIVSTSASVNNQVGTPSVTSSYVDGVLTFTFENLKGNTGDPAGFGAVTASVDSNIGTPSVQVQTSGPDTAKAMSFQFHNLKGETGVTSVVATVDNTTGNPTCAVSLVGQELHLDFTGLKGVQGDTGVSADYPITIANNLTTNDPTSALSAAMGVQLESEISQLELKVDDFKAEIGNVIQDLEGDSLSVCDGDGNVIAKVDENGVKSVDVEGAGRKLSEMPIPWYNDALYVTDGNGNVVAKIDADGIKTVGFDTSGKFSQKFKAIQVSGEVEAGAVLSTPTVQIENDILLSALIDGTIEKVQVGLGKTAGGYGYWSHWLEIDSTAVKLYRYVTESQLLDTFTHGLTLTDKTVVMVESKIVGNTKETTLKIYNDLGGVFTQSLSSWGLGRGFVLNQNASTALTVSLSLMPMSIVKKVWLFGDSYINFYANNRWPYYFAQLGLTDFFANNQPGLTPENALASLEYILTLGYVPSILVWCLGMNGPGTEVYSGGVYTINPDQKRVLDRVLAICKEYGIIPVLATIPTVPTAQKTGYCNYVRSLGVRYIDFADAVGADSAGNWNTGLLSEDNVHPSTLGAIVLASRAFVDCPELSVND